MKNSDEVYNVIYQPGTTRVLTVEPLQLCPLDKKFLNPQELTKVCKNDPLQKFETLKLKSQKAPRQCEVPLTLQSIFRPIPQFTTIPDTVVPPRAYAAIPRVLQSKSNEILPRTPLPEYAQFGPVQGVMKTVSTEEASHLIEAHVNNHKPLYLLNKDGGTLHIDVSDHDKSNWISLLPLGSQESANIWICQKDTNLYAVSIKSIASRVPLMVGYSKDYAKAHKIPECQPICDLNEEFRKGSVQWWCNKCSVHLKSSEELKNHKDFYHTENVSSAKYRCKYCCKTFTRLFSLKRHKALKCTKTKTKEEDPPEIKQNQAHTLDRIENLNQLNTTEDDHRLPSDESLQNFTSMLDFSTNLFDSDRISNLDISGCARSDNDFNLINDFDFDEALVNSLESPDKVPKKNNITSMRKTSSPYTCTFCKQTVPKTKVRQHAKLCLQRRFHCQVCRRFFRSKDTLALHVFNVHKENESLDNPLYKDKDVKPYKCSHCDVAFKRRGMLVNHMSRSHDATAARLPLLVSDRRFPCPRCPKIYSAAAKRDYHVANHHPGIEYNRSYSIELGQRVKQASSCELCPRQYATKAKLRQHIRQRHPGAVYKDKDVKPYKCSHCDVAFKRRGMLVNHMSRSHDATAARLPLLVSDRRFPCPRCPKIYSAAAKRDYHVANHHPGIEYNRSYSIELGQRVKQASSCELCPRQYATKAKLRQHIRQRHPGAVDEKMSTGPKGRLMKDEKPIVKKKIKPY